MRRFHLHLLSSIVLLVFSAASALAAGIPVGYVSFDATGANTAEFDIVNLTGPNSSSPGDPSFPITTSVSLTSLSLKVDYAGGSSFTFGSSYFTLDSDGLSFDGKQLSTLSGSPTGLFNAVDATLTGLFVTRSLTLNDGSKVSVMPGFSVQITDPSGKLTDGDLGVINAAPVPEPATWTLLATGMLCLLLIAQGRRRGLFAAHGSHLPSPLLSTGAKRGGNLRGSGLPAARQSLVTRVSLLTVAVVGTALLPAASGAATVKLNALSSPSTAAAASSVSVTGSGFPSGAITPSGVSVTLATSCAGAGSSATATAVTKVLGTTEKVEFAIPGSLAAGTYYASLSGSDANGTPFSSATCSTVQVTAGPSAVLTINTANGSDWKISNGALNIDFNPLGGQIFGIFPAGTTDNLVDLTNVSSKGPKGFYMDNAGPGAVTGVPGYVNTGSYIDWYVTYPSSSANAYTYTEHFVVLPNDSGIHVYFTADHATTDIAGSLGQIQWVFREDLNKFPNTYSVNADLSNPGPTAIPLPSAAEDFSTDPGRAVQDATVDLHGFTDIPTGFTRSFYTKYDYSSYEYLHRAHGVYGSQYGAWVVLPSTESLAGGPTKQDLIFTGNLDIIEALSGHLDNSLALPTAAGVASHRLFGPFYVRLNSFGGAINTPDDMYADAVAAGSSFSRFYDNETQLLAGGYVPSTARGAVSVQITGALGAPKTAWAVLSDPARNFQYSSVGAQYWADISSTGSATFSGVIPGTYRLSVYDLGQWGELRQDNIVVNANQTTVVPTTSFVPENFSPNPPVFAIGTADRSSHEFLHGHDAAGHDDREFWGTWNYWADFSNNAGAVIYNATAGPAGPATNDLSKWNYNHWQIFDPGLFGGVYNSADDTTDGYKNVIPPYVASLPGSSGTNGVTTRTPPWTVHFATPQNAFNNSYAVLSVALAAAESNYTVTLNGHALTWSKLNASDSAVRSGLSGYTQWIAYQWDVAALNPVGADNVMTITVNSTQGCQDDALRFELTSTSADPAVRGWNDYEFLYNTTDTKAGDSKPNP